MCSISLKHRELFSRRIAMEPIYTSEDVVVGPIGIQKLVCTQPASHVLFVIAENHRLHFECNHANTVSWIQAWQVYARNNIKKCTIHFMVEVGFHEYKAFAETASPDQPIHQICAAFYQKTMPSNTCLYDFNARYYAPFYLLEMMYNQDFYETVLRSASYKIDRLAQVPANQRFDVLAKTFHRFELHMFNTWKTSRGLFKFFKAMFMGSLPLWFSKVMEFYQWNKDGCFTAWVKNARDTDHEWFQRYTEWVDERLEETLLKHEGKISPFLVAAGLSSPFAPDRQVKFNRDPIYKAFFIQVMSLCQDAYMLMFYHHNYQKKPNDMFVCVVGHAHGASMEAFFRPWIDSTRSRFSREKDGCIVFKET